MKHLRFFLAAAFALIIVVIACKKETLDEAKVAELAGNYSKGVLVMNAGNVGENNGTMSHLAENNIMNFDIFKQENARSIAGNLTDYIEINNKGILLVDNALQGKDAVEIVSAGSFKSIVSLGNGVIENPRRIARVSDKKAYITAWDLTGEGARFFKTDGYVAVLDLEKNTIVKKIIVQHGAESILVNGKEAFIGNAASSKFNITVINTETDEVQYEILVGRDPSIIGIDNNNKLWVYAASQLLRIDLASKVIEKRLDLGVFNSPKTARSFTISKDRKSIYFVYSQKDATNSAIEFGETYRFNIDQTAVNLTTPFINRLFSGGLFVDAKSGYLYTGFVPKNNQAGYVFKYSADGVFIDSLKAEYTPNRFYFK